MASIPARAVSVKGTASVVVPERLGDVLVVQEFGAPRIGGMAEAEVGGEGPKEFGRAWAKHPHGHDPCRFAQQDECSCAGIGGAVPCQRGRHGPNELHPGRAHIQASEKVVGMGFGQPNAQSLPWRMPIVAFQQGAQQHRTQGKTTHPVQDFVGAHFDVALAKMPSGQGPRTSTWPSLGATKNRAAKPPAPMR